MEKEVNLVKDNLRRMSDPYKVIFGTLYCKMIKQYSAKESDKTDIAVMLRDYEIEKAKTQGLDLIVSIPDRGFEYMKVLNKDIDNHILVEYDRVYGELPNQYKLVKFEYIPTKNSNGDNS